MDRIETQFKECLKIVTSKSEITSPIYVIIPRAGCSACISSAEDFMIKVLNDPGKRQNFKFILTDFDSKKMLRARFGPLMNNPRVIIDPNNVFKANKSLKSVYPTVFFFDKNSRLESETEISPNRDGLADIATYLNTNS